MKNIKMVKESYIKKGSKWSLVETENNNIDEQHYKNIIESKSFFTNLGGYERHEKSYTSKGYIVTRINSISPDKQNKSVYIFDFD